MVIMLMLPTVSLQVLAQSENLTVLATGYTKFEKKNCAGSRIQLYHTLAEAIESCDANNECGSITSSFCDSPWSTCRRSAIKSPFLDTMGPCTWVKQNYEAIVKCERTYEGGCLNWQKLLMEVFNGPFTVEDCYAQCSKYSDCAGFFI